MPEKVDKRRLMRIFGPGGADVILDLINKRGSMGLHGVSITSDTAATRSLRYHLESLDLHHVFNAYLGKQETLDGQVKFSNAINDLSPKNARHVLNRLNSITKAATALFPYEDMPEKNESDRESRLRTMRAFHGFHHLAAEFRDAFSTSPHARLLGGKHLAEPLRGAEF